MQYLQICPKQDYYIPFHNQSKFTYTQSIFLSFHSKHVSETVDNMQKLSSLATPEFVKMNTSGVTSGKNVIKSSMSVSVDLAIV